MPLTDPIFESGWLGSHTTVYPDRVEWKLLGKRNSILMSQIASVELPPLISQVNVITTSGKKFAIPTSGKNKKRLRDAILDQLNERAVAPGNNAPSSLDELKKLADLKAAGIVTQEEFDAKKKQLLG